MITKLIIAGAGAALCLVALGFGWQFEANRAANPDYACSPVGNCWGQDACENEQCHYDSGAYYIYLPSHELQWKDGPKYEIICQAAYWLGTSGCSGESTDADYERLSCGIVYVPPGDQ